MNITSKARQASANKQTQAGIAALIIILTFGAVALLMAQSAANLGLRELDLGFMSARAGAAFSVVDGCAEEALLRLRLDQNYGVGQTAGLSVLGGSCTISISDTGSAPVSRKITVIGTSGEYTKSIEVNVTIIQNVVDITSWEEK